MKGTFKFIATNKKAYHFYNIEETYEAGIALEGCEVKSIRAGAIDIRDGYGDIRNGEAYLYNVYIAEYDKGSRYNKKYDPRRPRKLLLHKKEIMHLAGCIAQKGYTLVPLEVYFKNNYVKVKLGLGKGKKVVDKREEIKRKAIEREILQELRSRSKG